MSEMNKNMENVNRQFIVCLCVWGLRKFGGSESEGEGSVGQVGEHVDVVAAAADRQHLKHTRHLH